MPYSPIRRSVSNTTPSAPPASAALLPEDIFRNFDLNDILRQFGFGGNFRTGGGGTFTPADFVPALVVLPLTTFSAMAVGVAVVPVAGRSRSKEDLTYELSVSLEDVLHGTEND